MDTTVIINTDKPAIKSQRVYYKGWCALCLVLIAIILMYAVCLTLPVMLQPVIKPESTRQAMCLKIYHRYVYHTSPDNATLMSEIVRNVTSESKCYSKEWLFWNLTSLPSRDVYTYVLINNLYAGSHENMYALAEAGIYANVYAPNDLVWQIALLYGDFDMIALQYDGHKPEVWHQWLSEFDINQYLPHIYQWQILNAVLQGNATLIQDYIRMGATVDFDDNVAMRLAIATHNMDVILALWQKPKLPNFTEYIYMYWSRGDGDMARLLYRIYLLTHYKV